jgi:hypothetical protein
MGEESSDDPAELRAASDAHDRRTHLKRLGLGVAAAGAWVTPQVLGAPRASAGCTPVLRRMQFFPSACARETPDSVGGCLPTDWDVATDAVFSHSCFSPSGSPSSNISQGGSITISATGCTPVSAVASRVCTSGSLSSGCVTGSISGSTVTFSTVPSGQCFYEVIRIVISCCT